MPSMKSTIVAPGTKQVIQTETAWVHRSEFDKRCGSKGWTATLDNKKITASMWDSKGVIGVEPSQDFSMSCNN